MDGEALIKAVQAKLDVTADGRIGPETLTALYKEVVGKAPTKSMTVGKADPRSEATMAKLQPELLPYGRMLVARAAGIGIEIKLISGYRTYAEQDELFAVGRTKELNRGRVTNAKGGESNHNFGIAFDIGVFDGKTYIPNDPAPYNAVGAIGTEIGLEWGGNWKTFKDKPHYQLRPVWARLMSESEMLAELRDRVKKGVGPYA